MDASDAVIRRLSETMPMTFERATDVATRCVSDYILGMLREPDRVFRLWDRIGDEHLRPHQDDTLWDVVVESTRLQLLDYWELVPVEAIDLWLTEALEHVGVERDDATEIHGAFILLRRHSQER